MAASKASRIVFQASSSMADQLERTASELDLSKVKALQLAVSVLAKLSDKIGNGATVLIRDADGKETELCFPQIESNAAGNRSGTRPDRGSQLAPDPA